MSLSKRIVSELQGLPPGIPVTIDSLAERLHCSPAEVLEVGEELQNRAPGDEGLITVIKKISADDGGVYIAYLPLTLNDEPETR